MNLLAEIPSRAAPLIFKKSLREMLVIFYPLVRA